MMTTYYGKDYLYKEVIKLFEDMAAETWDLLSLGNRYACTPSEETLTDRHLLRIAASELKFLRVFKATKNLEGRSGFDWEWWIGNDQSGWLRYSVQAKRIDLRTRRYTGITKTVRGTLQIAILKDFSQFHGSIPLYCFYNANLDEDLIRAYWHCYGEFEHKQLGCVLAPLEVVEKNVLRRDTRSGYLLIDRNVIPWRCLFKCNNRKTHFPFHQISHYWSNRQPSFRVYQELPNGLGDIRGSRGLYESPSGAYPKRVIVVDTWRMLGNE